MRDDRPPLLGDELDDLCLGRTDGDHQPRTFAQLIEESPRELRCGRRDDDARVGRSAGQASASVSDFDGDVGVAKMAQNVSRLDCEFRMTFDGIHMLAQLREQCGLVSGAGADSEDCFVFRGCQKFQHERNDVGLRNGLELADGKWIVVVGLLAIRLGHKFVARDAAIAARTLPSRIPRSRVD